jgi:hypothetical protein
MDSTLITPNGWRDPGMFRKPEFERRHCTLRTP